MPHQLPFCKLKRARIPPDIVREFLREIEGKRFNHERPGEQPGDSIYGMPARLNTDTARLCSFLRSLSDKEIKLYSLELQLWWRRHQEADRAREAKEAQAVEDEAVRDAALKKLTRKERRVLGL